MIEYVLGFLFTPDREQVLLMEKSKPASQRGRLNGIGGKIEPGERPIEAMVREASEEVGITEAPWIKFAVVRADNWQMHCYSAAHWSASTAKAQEAEPVALYPARALPPSIMPNLQWLVGLALDEEIRNVVHIDYCF